MTTATSRKFFAAERSIAGPPISMFSIASSSVQSGFATVASNGYRLTTTMSNGTMPWDAIVFMWKAFFRTARIPPWIFGLSVFTRPSSISGKPVYSSISRTGTLFSRSNPAVPPEANSSTPSRDNPRANSATPDLSETLTIALRILAMARSPSFGL